MRKRPKHEEEERPRPTRAAQAERGGKGSARGIKSPARGLQSAARGAKSAVGGARSEARSSKASTRDVKSPKRDVKSAQRDVKSSQRDVRGAQRGIKSSQRDVKSSQRDVKGARRGEMSAARGLKVNPRSTPGATRVRTPSARGTRGSARHRDARVEPRELPAQIRPRRAVVAPTDEHQERRATTLGVTAKPVVRKRPDLSAEPHPGQFLLTTREGSEQDLIDELALLNVVDPPARKLAPALVLAPKLPRRDKRPVDLTFARQGFPIVQSVHAHDLDTISHRIARSLRGQLDRAKEYALHVWVPDSDLGNPLAALAQELEGKVAALLEQGLPDAKRIDDAALRRLGSLPFAQVC
ncbi:MAG TPA: hypothetical protein VI299_09785, partial [Polyangiales bacterium]